jgi:hypothetical protein
LNQVDVVTLCFEDRDGYERVIGTVAKPPICLKPALRSPSVHLLVELVRFGE